MTREGRVKARVYLERMPEAILLAVLTAVTTMVLAVLLSAVTGGEARQAVHEVIDHAQVTRCEYAQVVDMLRTLGAQSETIDFSGYPPVNTEGLDCERLVLEPFFPGRNDLGD